MFFPRHTPRSYTWTAWKAAEAIKGGQYQCVSEVDGTGQPIYTIWFYDEPEVHVCRIYQGTVPDGIINSGYPQSQNDSDLADFTTNFLPTANAQISPRAEDGRPAVRMTTASKARNFNLKAFCFVPGSPSTLVNQDATFNVLTDVTMTCYDVNGVVTTDSTKAVKTVLDWEPTYNYEVIGGWIDVPAGIAGGTTGSWWIGCIGVPDIPAAYGGSVNFVNAVNLEAAYTQQVVSDGRATQYLTYNAEEHTNKLRWTLKHPPSATSMFQIYVETFV